MSDICDICKGTGKFLSAQCIYCNGDGKQNSSAQSYMKYHICQCIFYDRKSCPVCSKPCHHDSSQNNRQTIDSGSGGMSSPKSKEILVT